MGRKRLEPRSNVVLKTAIYSGLSALVRLAQRRKSDRTKKFYASIEKKWNEVRVELKETRQSDPRNFSVVQNAEPKMRHHYLQMLWFSTRPYGNREFKRVYDWREGTVGPLNGLLNYAGAQLRNLAITRYPLSDPVFFQIRVYASGEKKIFSEQVAEKHPTDDAKKVYWRAGYRGNSKHPRILLTHPTLPSLDFVDMIRAHIIELCRQCFIHNVPMLDSHRYIRLIIHRLRPFLDWVYTQGETGQKDFFPDADKELRKIVLEIRSLYGKRIGTRERITSRSDEYVEPTVDLLRQKVDLALKKSGDEDVRERCVEILDKIDQGLIVDRDVAKIMNHVLSLSQREGNDWHRVLLSNLHHPPSLKSVIFAGDTMLDQPSDILVVGELPVSGGSGKADITVFVRRELASRVIWTPIMVLDIKSKTAFDFNLYAEKSRSGTDYLPSSYVWKTELTEKEWSVLVSSQPSRNSLAQLEAYDRGILQEYRESVPEDHTPPTSLWRGIVVVDTQQRFSEVFDAFQDMLQGITDRLHTLKVPEWRSFSIRPINEEDQNSPRITAILTSDHGPFHLIHERVPIGELHHEDPFGQRIRDGRHLALYIPVSSPTSFGVSAAWTSKNWHLLNHLYEISHSGRIIWLDLNGDYPTKKLLKTRFGLEKAYKKREITSGQYRNLSNLLESIDFIGLHIKVNDFLSGQSNLDSKAIRLEIESLPDDESIIVVDGWAEICDLIPRRQEHLQQVLEKVLLEALPLDNTEVIWIEGGSTHTKMNPLFQRKCIRPIAHNSMKQTQIDEVIWNLPVAPRVFGWQTPQRTDVRVIVQDTPTSVPPQINPIRIPCLEDWARKFRGSSRRDKLVDTSMRKQDALYGRFLSTSSTHESESLSPSFLHRNIMTLAPSLLRSRANDSSFSSDHVDDPLWDIISHPFVEQKATIPSNGILHLCPTQPLPIPNRSQKKYDDLKKISRGWMYDSFPSPEEYIEDWKGVTRRPVLTGLTSASEIDTRETRLSELKRILYAARFLKNKISDFSDLHGCLDNIIQICGDVFSEPQNEIELYEKLRGVQTSILNNTERDKVWRILYPVRQQLGQFLNSENRATLQTRSTDTKDLIFLYGNNLLLAVLAVAEENLDEPASLMVIDLWLAAAEWQPYQMGFKPQELPETDLTSRYDIQAIYSNLQWRAKNLKEIPQYGSSLSLERFGQAVWTEDEGRYDIWFVLPDRRGGEFIGGLTLNQASVVLRQGWYKCEIDPERLKAYADDALEGWNRNPILLTSVQGHEILWMKVEDDEGDFWNCLGVLDYGSPPRKRTYPIRWLAIGELPTEIEVAIAEYQPTSLPPQSLDESINRVLRKVQSWTGYIQSVECEVTLNGERNAFRVECIKKDSPKREVLASMETYYTAEVIDFLRSPFSTGEFITAKDGYTQLRWDYLSDVEYDNVELKREDGKREWINMSFLKPLVHRRSFHPDYYQIPQTCHELLKTSAGDEVKLVVSFGDGTAHPKISLEGLGRDSLLCGFENESMGVYDIALLAECEQMIEVDAQTRHNVEVVLKDFRNPRLPDLSNYDRIHNAIISVIEEGYESEDYDNDWDEEREYDQRESDLN